VQRNEALFFGFCFFLFVCFFLFFFLTVFSMLVCIFDHNPCQSSWLNIVGVGRFIPTAPEFVCREYLQIALAKMEAISDPTSSPCKYGS
jgi:hypothetical protein